MELNLRLLKLLLYMEPLPFTLLAGRQNLNPPPSQRLTYFYVLSVSNSAKLF